MVRVTVPPRCCTCLEHMRRTTPTSAEASGEKVSVRRHSSVTDGAALISVASFGAFTSAIVGTHLTETVSSDATPVMMVGKGQPSWASEAGSLGVDVVG